MKKPAMIFLSFVTLLTLTACGYTLEERVHMIQYETTARSNAVSYIKEKYDFKPTVVSVSCDTYDTSPVPDFSPGPTGNVYVELYNKKEDIRFWVYTTGEERNTEQCWDNYQYKAIEEAIWAQSRTLLGVEPKHIELAYGKNYTSGREINATDAVDKDYGLVHDYFDGTNLSEVLGKARYNKMVVCMVADGNIPDLLELPAGEKNQYGIYEGSFSQKEELVHRLGQNLECVFVNYTDVNACTGAHSDGCISEVGYGSLDLIDIYMTEKFIYIKDFYYVRSEQGSEEVQARYYKLELQQVDGFYYIAMGGSYCDFAYADEDMEQESMWNGHGFIDAQKIYDAYSIDSDAERIYLFVPISELEIKNVAPDTADIRIVRQAKNGKEWDYSSYITTKTGKGTDAYIAATIYRQDIGQNMLFSVLMDRDQ